ncbi:MAG: hypothetical protein GWN58_52695, partial [Anaerolineae bacterium]|nr:hypothetical protein [Anaerolineae bacterium]
MNAFGYEQALLSCILQKTEPIKMVSAELTADKFSYGPGGGEGAAHQLIYRAAVACNRKGVPPDVLNVGRQLGDKLEDAGGTAYLRELVGALQALSIRTVTENSI